MRLRQIIHAMLAETSDLSQGPIERKSRGSAKHPVQSRRIFASILSLIILLGLNFQSSKNSDNEISILSIPRQSRSQLISI